MKFIGLIFIFFSFYTHAGKQLTLKVNSKSFNTVHFYCTSSSLSGKDMRNLLIVNNEAINLVRTDANGNILISRDNSETMLNKSLGCSYSLINSN